MTPEHCQSEEVGPDAQLAVPGGTRQIRFTWLRDLLTEAGKYETEKDAADKAAAARQDAARSAVNQAAQPSKTDPDVPVAPNASAKFQPPSVREQLVDARNRLAADSRAAAQLAQSATDSSAPTGSPATPKSPASSVDASSQRKALEKILSASEYHLATAGPTIMDRIREKVGNWINQAIGKLQQAGFKSKWIGITAEIVFVLALSIVIVWFLIRLERQGRLGLALIRPEPGTGAASARDWQLWLEDARKAAAQGAWRDAVHLVYWASISRLESSGLWPADRARTPREYLALLGQDDAQRPALQQLTHRFERTWYAGRPAAEDDFVQAELLAARLGAGSSAASRSKLGAR
jgi:hypothetical protein